METTTLRSIRINLSRLYRTTLGSVTSERYANFRGNFDLSTSNISCELTPLCIFIRWEIFLVPFTYGIYIYIAYKIFTYILFNIVHICNNDWTTTLRSFLQWSNSPSRKNINLFGDFEDVFPFLCSEWNL